jgi:hypothetical protein
MLAALNENIKKRREGRREMREMSDK